MEYRRIPTGTKWIYVGNNTRVEVKGVGTCKLVLDNDRTLLLHDVLFEPDIRRNIISVAVLMGLGYLWRFYDSVVDLYFNNSLVCNGYLNHGFIVLKTICNNADSSNEIFHVTNSVTNESHIICWHARLGHIGPIKDG